MSQTRKRWMVGAALLLGFVGATACGASSGTRTVARDNTVITAEELSRIAAPNAYEAVAQLRPLWLRPGARRSGRALPTEIVVAQNSNYFGPVTSLRLFQMVNVRELRYMDSSTAGAFISGLGSRHVDGAIIVVPR